MYEDQKVANCKSIASAADETVKAAETLMLQMEALADRVRITLSPITIAAPPSPCATTNNTIVREYPPLFADLRDKFLAISNSMDTISETISRVDL